jgi:hypothetical protein
MSNELDKQFSDRLIGYESAVDAEALWEAVKPPRKKRPWAWLWLLLVGGIVLFSASWWYLDDEQGSISVVATNTTEAKTQTTSKNEAAIIENQTTAGIKSIAADAASPEVTAANTTVSVSPTDLKTKPTLVSVETTTLTESTSATTDDQETVIATAQTKALEESSDKNFNSPDLIPSTESTNPKNTEEDSNAAPLKTIEASSRTQQEAASLITTLDMGLLPSQINTTLPALTTISEDSYFSKSSPWFLQLDAGYYGLQRTLSNNDTLGNEWIDKRKQTESLLEANSFDVTLGYQLTKKWELRTGFAYTQINTAFNYTASSIEVDTVEGLQVIVYENGAVVDSIFGPVASYTATLQEKRTYNSFRQWEVPLLLAYNFGAGKIHYQAEAGLRLLVQRQWEGNIINTSNEFVDLSERDWYRNSLGVSFQAGIKAMYDLTPRTSVLAGFSARYHPQQFTTDNAPFKERYQLLGASIGLRHRF